METMCWFKFLAVVTTLMFNSYEASTPLKRKTHIVHMQKKVKPTAFAEHAHWYRATLQSVSKDAEPLYVYNNVLDGFAAPLTTEEAELLGKMWGVVQLQEEQVYKPLTTRVPQFLGLEKYNNNNVVVSRDASNVIIGVFDTGVWPKSRSLMDQGMPPVPDRWKGSCDGGEHFPTSSCNRKLIGAKFYSEGFKANMKSNNQTIDENTDPQSPVDTDGHGSHTASTACGSAVHNASIFSYAKGTARGMATQARLAIYKVCWSEGCFSSDIVAAVGEAIRDGVDIISFSLQEPHSTYAHSSMAIAAFKATMSGIFVSCAAGNSGPEKSSVTNLAPWITTVGAGTLDRNFSTTIQLGNGKSVAGATLHDFPRMKAFVPLVYAGNVSTTSNTTFGHLCLNGTLNPEKVRGKIVMCDRGVNLRVEKGFAVKQAGGAGMILANSREDGEWLVADAHVLIAAAVGFEDGKSIKSYIFSTKTATARIGQGQTVVDISPAPVVASFSSRGPSTQHEDDILKPDLIAPGVHILAAWTGLEAPTELPMDKRRTEFNIAWGTSMSCPVVSGIAALLKAKYPAWSPAAIKSALMTTATVTSNTGEPIVDDSGQPANAFDFGAGQVNFEKALDPGLVYNITNDDYINFLCAKYYRQPKEVKVFTITSDACKCIWAKGEHKVDLNYPAFVVSHGIKTFKRTLTNVGLPSEYQVQVSAPPGIDVIVSPRWLQFRGQNEEKAYTVTFNVSENFRKGNATYGYLAWTDNKNHFVRSVIALS